MAINAERIRSLVNQVVETFEALPAADSPYDGHHGAEFFKNTQLALKRISQIYLDELSLDPRFLAGEPVLLGSWARDELTPQSDLDLGFCSESEETRNLIQELQATGLPFRIRILTTRDVQFWPLPEQMIFFQCRPLTETAKIFCQKESDRLVQGGEVNKKKWVRELRNDRDEKRTKGFDFENVLEPHLKTGRGGLREIRQAIHLQYLMPDIWDDPHFRTILDSCLWYFLTLRLELKRLGGNDFLQAGLQSEIAKRLHYADFKEFMRIVQMSLSRVAFYSDVMFETALASPKRRRQAHELKFESVEDLLRAFRRDPSLLVQNQVRRQMAKFIGKNWLDRHGETFEEFMSFLFSRNVSEEHLMAAFRSRLVDMMDRRLRRLVGYNQHDQYHAFTAETHILNLLHLVKKAFARPTRLGLFRSYLQQMTVKDEFMLMWAAYYHDLAKGMPGDHEVIGEKWVWDDAKKWGRTKYREEVAWLVKNHLEFSKAAFREDPHDEKTWQRLYALELKPTRIRRLMVFTVLDIQATHPKAWTPWKEKLLFDLGSNLLDPKRISIMKEKMIFAENYNWPDVSMALIQSIGSARLKKDLRVVKPATSKSGFRIEKTRGGYWVRYLDREDRPGVLVSALKSLFAVGASVEEAWVQTLPGVGVYDWFFVSSTLSPASFEKRLALIDPGKVALPHLRWQSLEIEKRPNSNIWVLQLVGQDARGLLVWTAEQIAKLGGNIQSARIQTWGSRAEDRVVVDWGKLVQDNEQAVLVEKSLRDGLLS